MMSTQDCAASVLDMATVRAKAVILSLSLVTATMTVALALCWIQPANAQQRDASFAVPYTGTLKKINDSGEIRIGYRENSPPFAFLDAQRKPVGYSLDLCEIVVEEVAAELGKDIQVVRRRDAGEPLRACHLRRSRPRMRVDHELSNVARRWRFRRPCS
jgi:ABC-type amino acid transport substrate-binding protein